MTYLDNAATSFFKPPEVINAVANTLKYLSANPGRSGHSMSTKAGLLVHQARSRLASFIDCPDSSRVVFTLNCTAALNTAILGTVKKGGHIITTACEHNSVIRPLFELQRKGLISLTVLAPDASGAVSLKDIKNALRPNTYMVATTHISNVTGAETDVKNIGEFTRSKGLLFLVDGAQSVGYGDVLLDGYSIDLLSIAPHKGLHAVQGVGALAISRFADVKPNIFGGTGTSSESVYQPEELPEGLESGTLPTPAIAGLNAALIWTQKNQKARMEKMGNLCKFCTEELKKMPGVTVYNPPGCCNSITAFNIEGLSSVEVSGILSDEYDVCVRGGLHCAPLMHRFLGTLERGIVRASFGIDNTYAEVEFFLNAIREIAGKKY